MDRVIKIVAMALVLGAMALMAECVRLTFSLLGE